MSLCECGCKEEAQGGAFLKGHDQKLRTHLEERVGGLLSLRDVVDAIERYVTGDTTMEDLGKAVRRVYAINRKAV